MLSGDVLTGMEKREGWNGVAAETVSAKKNRAQRESAGPKRYRGYRLLFRDRSEKV